MKIKKLASTLALTIAAIMVVESAAVCTSAFEYENATTEGELATISPYGEELHLETTFDEIETVDVSENEVSLDDSFEATMSGQSGILGIEKPGKTRIATALATIYNTKYDLYKTVPSVKSPFSLGAMSDEAVKRSLASVNVMRMIAGLPFVSTDAAYMEYAQAAAVLCGANNTLSKTQNPPAGMDTTFLLKGNTGCSASNLSGGYATLAEATIGSMRDKSTANAANLGHRRWLINPKMAKTGFGFAPSADGKTVYGATYAYDQSATVGDYDYIAWPASGYFPNNIMNASDPWSISFNPDKVNVNKVDLSKITVLIKGVNGQQYIYSVSDITTNQAVLGDQSLPFITYNTQGYGINNCIIFRPGTKTFGTSALSGDYTVSILGLEDNFGNTVNVSYTISFFDPQNYIKGTVDLSTLQLSTNESAVSAFVKRLYNIALQRTPKENEVNYWKESLVDREKNGAEVARGFFFSKEFTNKNLSDEDYVETLYKVMMGRESDAAGKADWVYKLKNGVTREGVFKGFTDSAEFSNICKSYGIDKGTVSVGQSRDKNPNLTTFVARLYTKALGRTYEDAGLNDWCERIISKSWTIDDVSTNGFFHSAEFMNKKLSNSDYIKTLYRTFFDREYDQDGYDYWMKRMNNGATRDDVLKGFSNSAEFYNLKKKFGV